MKVVARRSTGDHEVVLEIWMTKAQATHVLDDKGRLTEDLEDMSAEALKEHLTTNRLCQRTRMTPHS